VAERSFGCLRFEALQWDTATSPGDKREGRYKPDQGPASEP
jgi:hypothetical protein